MINNPIPITPSTFSGMWITNLQIILNNSTTNGRINAMLLPYDGVHLLALGGKQISTRDLSATIISNHTLNSAISELLDLVSSRSKNTSAVLSIQVVALDPSKPVTAMVHFSDGNPYRINDCFKLCSTDAVFYTVFNNTMIEIAKLANLTVS